MYKATLLAISLSLFYFSHSQNVGIGTSNPTGPLSFANTIGNKLVLWGNGNLNHYGIGIQGGTFQLYADQASSIISFGYGSSDAFTERMKVINSGGDGLEIKGRLSLKNGTNPIDPAYGAGIWLYRPDNTSAVGFMGVQNSQNIGFFGGPASWGFTYDAINSRVGIGNNTPAVRLDIGGTDGWDLVNGEGDMRIGNASNRLKFGIALGGGGIGAAGIMQHGGIGNLSLGAGAKYLLQMNGPGGYVDFPNNTGGIRINGSAGTAGQVLTSNGGGAAASWNTILPLVTSEGVLSIATNVTQGNYPGANLNFSLSRPAKVLLFATIRANKTCVVGPCSSSTAFFFSVDGQQWPETYSYPVTTWPVYNWESRSYGPIEMQLNAGAHTIVFGQFLSVGAPMSFTIKAGAFWVDQ